MRIRLLLVTVLCGGILSAPTVLGASDAPVATNQATADVGQDLVISGPLEWSRDQLVVLDGKGVTTEHWQWIVLGEQLAMPRTMVSRNADVVTLGFAGGVGQYRVFLIDGARKATCVLTIREGQSPAPAPGPAPAPRPQPAPVFPEEYEGVALATFQAVQKLPAQHRLIASSLAKNYRQVASGVRGDNAGASDYASWAQAKAQLKQWNRESLGWGEGQAQPELYKAWIPVFAAQKEKLDALEAAGKCEYPQEALAFLGAVAAGLQEGARQ